MCTSLLIWFTADVISQQIGDTEYDAAQTGRMLIIGGSASIPMFSFISTRVQVRSGLPKVINTILTATIRTAITCCFITPAMSAYFFSMHSIMLGNSMASTWEHLQYTFPKSLEWTFRYWPMVNVINFSLIPIQFRGSFQALAGLVWQTYLAWLNRRTMDMEKVEEGQCECTEESNVLMSQAPLEAPIEF
ncbi:hypothetical protein KVR01_006604 [Diaporthe batatas]|uniref:uncharacterized protein n=1 Tax=Diaporthe batatas TaxID=748121 RepID=UPI001D051FC8|nr:uncharacterized protein KVR01_006604 [Diaporthe batatas]KAG8163307.1 hypothetical protein KVR01_006604 [Diaporthe batatas]